MDSQQRPPELTNCLLPPIFFSYHPRCCGAGRETGESRFLHFRRLNAADNHVCKKVEVNSFSSTILHMTHISPSKQRVLDLVRKSGAIRLRDVTALGLHPEHLRRLVEKGLIIRLTRGVYALAGFEPTENHGLAQVAIRVPNSVVCLLSALQFYGLTTQMPRRVWIALSPKTRTPQLDWPQLQVHRFSGASFTEGWAEHLLEGVPVKIYEPAKTVADCFKFRNVVGLDVAIEALRDCLRENRATVDELVHFGKICRVDRVMRPYMEALV
jgi:predicted transcriptional regulator of viral defense system